MEHGEFEKVARKAPAGSDGLFLLPYLEGERTPNVPEGTGIYLGVTAKTFDAAHFARATMEGVTLGMNYGLRRLAELGVKATQVRATGGGAKSKLWRQIMRVISIFSRAIWVARRFWRARVTLENPNEMPP